MAGEVLHVDIEPGALVRPICANVSEEYSAGVESLNTQAIVRPLTGMKPPVRRMTLNRPDLAHCSPTTLHYTIPLTAKSANFPAEYRAKIAAAPYYPYTRLPMIQQPETKYTKCSDITIAYQVYGDRPIDLVLALGWVSNLDYFWEHPDCARFIERFAKFARVLMFDRRGTGLSDRNVGTPTLE